ncbi:hypothetical protein IX51_10565 [uncultured archaeon]|nr:hypothetical protein IX51_10565 [uncultured archaeon]
MSEQVFGSRKEDESQLYGETEIHESGRTEKEISTFYLWFASNLTIADFALGFLPIEFGMSITSSIIALAIGNIAGGILLALMSTMGPKAGFPQMIIGMKPMGRLPGRIMSVLQWSNTGGWLTVNIVIASLALTTAFSGLNYILSIALSVVVVAIAAFLGGKAIHRFERIMSFVLGIMFAFVTIFSLSKMNVLASYSPSHVLPEYAAFGTTVAVSFSYIMSWSPYASDYSRYISSRKSGRKVFAYTFIGGAVASFWLEAAGLLVAIISGRPSGNPAGDLNSILGGFGVIGMLALFLGGLSANSLNLYSNSVSLKAVGVKMKRTTLVVIVSIIVMALAIIGYVTFYDFYETFLLILDYWITPWIGVVAADFFIANRGKKFSLSSIVPVNRTGVASYIVAILVSVPFMNPPVNFIGPIAQLLGGVDISYFVSFGVAVLLYTGLSKRHESN